MSEWRSLFSISTVKPRWLHMVYVKTNIFLNIIVWIAFINIINNSNKYIWSSPILTRLWYGCFHCRYHINTASIPQILVIIINNTVNQSPQQDILAEKKEYMFVCLRNLKYYFKAVYICSQSKLDIIWKYHIAYMFLFALVCLFIVVVDAGLFCLFVFNGVPGFYLCIERPSIGIYFCCFYP